MVLADTADATCARISSLDAATTARTVRRSWRASVLRDHSEQGLRVWECSTDHCWKQRHTTDTLCPTCAAIHRYVHPASTRLTMRPRSNDRIATTDARCLGQSIAGDIANSMTVCMREYTPALTPERATLCINVTVWSPLTVTCVTFGLNLLSRFPKMINYLSHKFAIQWSCPWGCCIFFRQCILQN